MVRFQGFGDVEFLHDLFALFHFSSTTLSFTGLFLHSRQSQRECQPRGQCASVDDVDAASSECKPLIYCSHNSHSLSNYSVDLARSS